MSFESFNKKKINHMVEKMFLGEGNNVARYDQQKHPFFDKIIDKQLSQFWRPEEIGLERDYRDWITLNSAEQHIFISNLKRQILLDSVQGRSPNVALLPIVTIPELETWIENWAGNETIHSRSYTHIIRNLFNEPDKIFDSIMDNEQIIKSATDITKYYDDLIEYNQYYHLLGYGTHEIKKDNGEKKKITLSRREHIKKIYLTIASINILEGIRFYVSFACSWAFNERELMEGNSKIITLICRDENVHLSSTQYILNNFAREFEDEGGEEIVKECEQEMLQMFDDAVKDEKKWAEYLFQEDSMIGLNYNLLSGFVEYIANKRLVAIGFEERYETKENYLEWTNKYIGGTGSNTVQTAPQETEISSYLIGQVNSDVGEGDFDSFDLD
tara:strand:+ start:375 stop:1532 length:1158 start_codon:yes stop_codon:yes gene_type:complete